MAFSMRETHRTYGSMWLWQPGVPADIWNKNAALHLSHATPSQYTFNETQTDKSYLLLHIQ
jgi:hypothetical protein